MNDMNGAISFTVAADASGAYEAALAGKVVLVVDLIDMSTTMEAALQSGARLVLGASPVPCKANVPVSPESVGRYAAEAAAAFGSEVVLVAEPRTGSPEERRQRASAVLQGLRAVGVKIAEIYPNLGAETVKLVDVRGRVVVAISDCGGTAFDTAWHAGAPVTTGTVARTYGRTGWDNAERAIDRALYLASAQQRDICLLAASGKAAEDVLAVRYLAGRMLELGYLRKQGPPDDECCSLPGNLKADTSLYLLS